MTEPDTIATSPELARYPSERRRVVTSAAVGVAVSAGLAFVAPWQLAVLAGWDIAAAALAVWVWSSIGRLDAASTQTLATREDNSRAASRAVVVVACVASLGGVFLGIIKARHMAGAGAVVLTVASIVAVALAWLTVHTMFTLRYAHRYYDIGGGIDFDDDPPTYLDFAYVAFTIGMTFQVSDTDISQRALRSLVLRHALLAYLFGTVIVGLTINVVAGLLG